MRLFLRSVADEDSATPLLLILPAKVPRSQCGITSADEDVDAVPVVDEEMPLVGLDCDWHSRLGTAKMIKTGCSWILGDFWKWHEMTKRTTGTRTNWVTMMIGLLFLLGDEGGGFRGLS